MKELGFDGSTLEGLVAASAAPAANAPAPEEKLALAHAYNDDPAKPAKRAKPVEKADVEAAE